MPVAKALVEAHCKQVGKGSNNPGKEDDPGQGGRRPGSSRSAPGGRAESPGSRPGKYDYTQDSWIDCKFNHWPRPVHRVNPDFDRRTGETDPSPHPRARRTLDE